MADTDTNGNAWRVPPGAYLSTRPAEFACPAKPFSLYLAMRDGCRIAVDVYLPQATSGPAPHAKLPTIVILTPYYRRFALKSGAPAGTENSPNAAKYRDFFVPRGYALVVVDVRGTGASFGTRDSFRSPAERDDYREIADWIVAQPWSDGVIGSTGISYLGAAALFLASTGHPAVKAIAPLFSVWNTYVDHFYPGGVLLDRLAASYDRLMVGLDHDRRDILATISYFKDPNFEGPQPVDGDNGAQVRQAVKGHLGNFHMPDFISEFRFTDDRLPYDPNFGAPSFSPYHYAEGIDPGIAIYSISGWMDGAGFANGSIARFLSLPNKNQHLLLGPWDHGARTNVSPFRDAVEPRFNVLAEVLRFFDQYLMGRDTGLGAEQPVHYFSMRGEAWHEAPAWPPVAQTRQLALAEDHTLAETAREGEDAYQADFSIGTGSNTRHERLAAENTLDYYGDWHGRDAAMLSYTSAPLTAETEVSGHVVVDLWLASSEGDAAVHVYLSEVEPDGTTRYVTEGVLRAIHRKESKPEPKQKWSWPFHTFARADAQPMPKGKPERLRFALIPTSWTFGRGSRVRISIAGGDADHYAQVPHGRPPLLTVRRGGAMASSVTLPWREPAV
jgi:putative CocE/NonD family hydrolase